MDDPGSSSSEAGFTPTTLDVAVDGPVGKVVLGRPAQRNAMSYEMLEELIAAARWMDDRPDVKVVVFSGAGPAFCGGFDLTQVGDGSAPGRGADVGYRMSSAIAGMRAMTIAAVHSHCVGGGVVLAAACDLRVAASSALFRIPEVDLGMPLFWNGIPLLVREIGPALTKELVLTGRSFDAGEAKAIGFVNRVVPDPELPAVADALAAELAAKPGLVLTTTKQQVTDAARWDAGGGSAVLDAQLLAGALRDPECRAAGVAYLERRARRPPTP